MSIKNRICVKAACFWGVSVNSLDDTPTHAAGERPRGGPTIFVNASVTVVHQPGRLPRLGASEASPVLRIAHAAVIAGFDFYQHVREADA